MAMTWTSLTAAKGVSGALATWVDYTKLDVPVIVDEAQTLLYSLLRTREMLTDYNFTVPANNSYVALPARFLDMIGDIHLTSFMQKIRHKESGVVQRNRSYQELSGTLGASPFTTVSGSNTVSVALTTHGFTQDSVFYTTGASTFNGATIVGTFPVTGITDANNFTIDVSSLGTTPSGTGAGGGAGPAYTCDQLTTGMPQIFGIWNETIYFDTAFSQTALCKFQLYRSLPLLSATNTTNFLTDRYPHLLRKACEASAADFMKDDAEYAKQSQALAAFVQRVNVENDMSFRGMDITTDTP